MNLAAQSLLVLKAGRLNLFSSADIPLCHRYGETELKLILARVVFIRFGRMF